MVVPAAEVEAHAVEKLTVKFGVGVEQGGVVFAKRREGSLHFGHPARSGILR